MNKPFLFSILLLLFSAPVFSSEIVDFQLVKRLTFDDLHKHWARFGVPEFFMPIHNEIDVYDITYTTRWHDGSPIKASGLYLVPVGASAAPQLIYHHGTSVRKERGDFFFNGEETLCFFFAVDGYAVIMPDYIGLGRGEKRHLYQHADSEGQAAVDMLAAVNELNTKLNIQSNGQLFLTGYSQGGHATLATHKKMEAEYANQYKITASSGMSGAYDMTGAQSVTMSKPYTQPHYLPYLLESYQEAYKIVDGEIYNIYKPQYKAMLKRLYSGKYQHYQINDSLPKIPQEVILDSMVSEFKTNPNFPFFVQLKANNLCDWKPNAPVMLVYSTRDEEVNYLNSVAAYKGMKAQGATNIRRRCLSRKFGHNNTAGFATMQTKFFFDSFRSGSKRGHLGPLWKRSVLRIAMWITPEKALPLSKKALAEKQI